MQYSITEISGLSGLIKIGYPISEIFCLNCWLVEKLNKKLISQHAEYSLFIVRVNNFGDFPSIGILGNEVEGLIVENEVEKMGNKFLFQTSISDYISYMEKNRFFLLKEYQKWLDAPTGTPFIPSF